MLDAATDAQVETFSTLPRRAKPPTTRPCSTNAFELATEMKVPSELLEPEVVSAVTLVVPAAPNRPHCETSSIFAIAAFEATAATPLTVTLPPKAEMEARVPRLEKPLADASVSTTALGVPLPLPLALTKEPIALKPDAESADMPTLPLLSDTATKLDSDVQDPPGGVGATAAIVLICTELVHAEQAKRLPATVEKPLTASPVTDARPVAPTMLTPLPSRKSPTAPTVAAVSDSDERTTPAEPVLLTVMKLAAFARPLATTPVTVTPTAPLTPTRLPVRFDAVPRPVTVRPLTYTLAIVESDETISAAPRLAEKPTMVMLVTLTALPLHDRTTAGPTA